MSNNSAARLTDLENRMEVLLARSECIEHIETLLSNLQVQLEHSPTSVHGAVPQPRTPFQVCNVKLDFPRFDGRDVLGWIFRAEQFFYYYNTPDEDRITIAAIHMDGDAVSWYQMMQCANPFHSWPSLARVLESEFGPSPFDCPRATLFKLSQTTKVNSLLLSIVFLVWLQMLSLIVSSVVFNKRLNGMSLHFTL
ncbi:hypothetical protein S245_040997 [Arachis hypogaea]